MDISIFNDITTEDQLQLIEVESSGYVGLYVEMNDIKQRGYVKAKAKTINDLLKKVERARIDKVKDFKAGVTAEAKEIAERLLLANKPFTLLLDEYNEERAKVLAAEKARVKAIEDAQQLENDHELALLMNDKHDHLNKFAVDNMRVTNNAILGVLKSYGISEDDGVLVVKLIAKGILPNVTINYQE